MDSSDPTSENEKVGLGIDVPRKKPQVLLAACGCAAGVKFTLLCHCFLKWAEVRAVVTKSSLHFIDAISIPKDVFVFYDEHELCSTQKTIGDCVLHTELCKWADIMVIAPLSANTLAKIAGGICDNLLTCIVRTWDQKKPLYAAPSMNKLMWKNPFTEMHCRSLHELGISLIPPVPRKKAGEEYENGAMDEPFNISYTVKEEFQNKHVGVVRPC
ncbi:hypothetical protein VNO77_20838 [Canavalia gladiata]|uniref:phosphopantothenoylcysteine decarboxylase n=1 Tax=Canavalia gladiata TaxID=3824 RepID=A0AAN9QLK7_CANGL